MSKGSTGRVRTRRGSGWLALGVLTGMALLAPTGSAAARGSNEEAPLPARTAPADDAVANGLIASGPCGAPGQSPCPLQAYMRASIATPLASNDIAALAAALDRTRRFAPDPSWTSWATFAAEGAAAAQARDIAKTRASCKGCHDAWRETYRARYRARPLPR
jgi:hypothetical protein